jgi:hypothetical protein
MTDSAHSVNPALTTFASAEPICLLAAAKFAPSTVIVPPVRATPEYLAHFVRSEIEKWTDPIKASRVTVE